jgi:hypothetical protein
MVYVTSDYTFLEVIEFDGNISSTDEIGACNLARKYTASLFFAEVPPLR